MNNNQHPKELISEADTMKNHHHNDSGTRKTQNKTVKHENFKGQNNSGENEKKAAEE